MTIIVCAIEKRKVYLAADGRTTAGGDVVSEKSNKIERYGQYVIARAGNSAAMTLLKHILDDSEVHPGPLEHRLVKYGLLPDTKISEDAQAIVLELNDKDEVVSILDVSIDPKESFVSCINLLSDGLNINPIGSGATVFNAAYTALEFNCPNMKMRERLIKALEITGQLNVWCNTNIKLMTMTLAKETM